ncbi:MAG: hypothetical protein BAJALOKI2v1_100035 [Promethearchaeota archaeon]|nr:MAG: hypothetical protein BAJALOKI2v1_100035 [Candidatus Lokiarchaeota archaeon]
MRFLVDAMLGKLSHLLRIFGYDTVYANDLIPYFQMDPVPDEKLLEYALEHNRVIITRDYPFHRRAASSIFLAGEGVYHYLNQLKMKLDLDFSLKIENARCSICNSILKEVPKASIKNKVKLQTYENYDKFYQCQNPTCQKVYWTGPHIKDIKAKIKKKLQ